MKLSPRLTTILNFVPHNSIVGDIGTDHGYIPVYLIYNRISKKVIATDISKDSLDKAKDYSKKCGLEKDIETRVGDGLEILKPFEVDTLIIAGMGGLLINEILDKGKKITDSVINFIFQPMGASDELRKYLINNNFKIIDERLAREGDKYYEIIFAQRGKSYIGKDIYYEIGEKLFINKDPLLKEFIIKKIEEDEKIIRYLNLGSSEKSREREKFLQNKIEDYKEVINYYESL
ncbi:MAG: SAM-dependent methyltransferase [Tissierellaceae bacterium]|nr:SAM-dependent methyltransferase [Tissierellaceae bacterium]